MRATPGRQKARLPLMEILEGETERNRGKFPGKSQNNPVSGVPASDCFCLISQLQQNLLCKCVPGNLPRLQTERTNHLI